ncbi:MAG: iron-sulfur cluster repair di-iron protein [Desulforhopalus sp.]
MQESNKTIGEIVAEDYRTSKVFEKFGIDFCCGGKVVLTEICNERGLDLRAILSDLETVKNKQIERDQDYASWELPFLIDYIINVHHGYLNENIELIKSYTRKIAQVHGNRHPELLEISSIFDKITSDMSTHLKEEEDVLFPALKSADRNRKTGTQLSVDDVKVIHKSLEELVREHDDIGAAIHKIRHLSNEYATPEDACNTYIITYKKLEEFENDLHKHVHLENNILFLQAGKL